MVKLGEKMKQCNEEILKKLNSNDKSTCEAEGFKWTPFENNYNNIFNSMLTFFEISTLEMWPDIMFNANDY